ncbi:MAG: type II toxin-antitoxin system VapC family toxin [Candidatus Aquicultorales bacterium]
MALDMRGFHEAIRRASSIGLDTSLLIYHLEDVAPYSNLTEELLSVIGKRQVECVLSSLCLTELLAGPLRSEDESAAVAAEEFVRKIPNVRIIPIDDEIAKLAARLRVSLRLKTPDALHLATAQSAGCSLFVTNDRALKRPPGSELEVLVLEDFL